MTDSVSPVKIQIVLALDPALADHVIGLVTQVASFDVFVRGDFADVTEQMGGQATMRIPPDRLHADQDPRKLRGRLFDSRDLLLREVSLQANRQKRLST